MGMTIVRGTLFKVPDPENRQKLFEACGALERDQAKVGLFEPESGEPRS
jgi:hypothetical protein